MLDYFIGIRPWIILMWDIETAQFRKFESTSEVKMVSVELAVKRFSVNQ